MKTSSIRSIVLVLAVVFAIALTAAAQGSGTVKLTGTVGSTASIRFDNADTSLTGATQTGSNSDNAPLAYTANFGDIAAYNGTSGAAVAKIGMYLRSNAAFTLSATVASTGLAATPSSGDITLKDFGYGVPDGGIKATSTGTGRSVKDITTNNYNLSPTTEVAGAASAFTHTLDELSTTGTVLKGGRISFGGNVNDTENALAVVPEYVLMPQYYTPGTNFDVTVTYTIATP